MPLERPAHDRTAETNSHYPTHKNDKFNITILAADIDICRVFEELAQGWGYRPAS
jgi:hypothetical protein